MLVCFHLLWMEIFISPQEKLNHGPKEQQRVVSSPLAVFLLFHSAFNSPKPKVQFIFLEKVNNLLTLLTLKITPKIKE